MLINFGAVCGSQGLTVNRKTTVFIYLYVYMQVGVCAHMCENTYGGLRSPLVWFLRTIHLDKFTLASSCQLGEASCSEVASQPWDYDHIPPASASSHTCSLGTKLRSSSWQGQSNLSQLLYPRGKGTLPQAGLKLLILLPQSRECWDYYSYTPPRSSSMFILKENMTLISINFKSIFKIIEFST